MRGITGTFFYRFGIVAGKLFLLKKFTINARNPSVQTGGSTGSADPEFARSILAAVFADIQDYFTTGTIGLFFQIAMVTIRFI
jgi:hypothetical protein